jgi:hypothetical protein
MEGESHEKFQQKDLVYGFWIDLVFNYLLHWVWTEKLQGIKISAIA